MPSEQVSLEDLQRYTAERCLIQTFRFYMIITHGININKSKDQMVLVSLSRYKYRNSADGNPEMMYKGIKFTNDDTLKNPAHRY